MIVTITTSIAAILVRKPMITSTSTDTTNITATATLSINIPMTTTTATVAIAITTVDTESLHDPEYLTPWEYTSLVVKVMEGFCPRKLFLKRWVPSGPSCMHLKAMRPLHFPEGVS